MCAIAASAPGARQQREPRPQLQVVARGEPRVEAAVAAETNPVRPGLGSVALGVEPSRRIVSALRGDQATATRRSVVLPVPLRPTMAMALPAGSVRSTPSSTTGTPGQRFTTPSSARGGGRAVPAAVLLRRHRGSCHRAAIATTCGDTRHSSISAARSLQRGTFSINARIAGGYTLPRSWTTGISRRSQGRRFRRSAPRRFRI